jgi:hypothetical protein
MDRGVAESVLALLMESGYTNVMERPDGAVSVTLDGYVQLEAGVGQQVLRLVQAVEELRLKQARIHTGAELIRHLEPHYTDKVASYWHTDRETGKQVQTQRRVCGCSGWVSHPDIEKIDPEANYWLNTRGTFPSWQKVV